MGILASFVLGSMYAAREQARKARTRATILKLHNEIMTRWESYQTRRLPVDLRRIVEAVDGLSATVPNQTVEYSYALGIRTLRAKRELMRMELPDRYRDLFFVPDNLWVNPNVPSFVPPLLLAYRRRVFDAPAMDTVPVASKDPLNPFRPDLVSAIKEIEANESAECLYLIVTTGVGGEGLGSETFSASEIGDTDGDEMPEFIDGWGNPIRWLRWAPGFESELQPVVRDFSPDTNRDGKRQDAYRDTDDLDGNNNRTEFLWGHVLEADGAIRSRKPLENHDSFDPRQIENLVFLKTSSPPRLAKNLGYLPAAPGQPQERGFKLTPLIFSAGQDGEDGLFFGRINEDIDKPPPRMPRLVRYDANANQINDEFGETEPYRWFLYDVTNTFLPRGAPIPGDLGGGHDDNIHNHFISTGRL